MEVSKPHYFSNYAFLLKLLLLVIFCFFIVCCSRNAGKQVLSHHNPIQISDSAVNINKATVEELEKLPFIGTKLAEKIKEHREKYGDFRKPEHLLLVPGISDTRFRQIRELIKTE